MSLIKGFVFGRVANRPCDSAGSCVCDPKPAHTVPTVHDITFGVIKGLVEAHLAAHVNSQLHTKHANKDRPTDKIQTEHLLIQYAEVTIIHTCTELSTVDSTRLWNDEVVSDRNVLKGTPEEQRGRVMQPKALLDHSIYVRHLHHYATCRTTVSL